MKPAIKNLVLSLLFILAAYVLICLAASFHTEKYLEQVEITGKCTGFRDHQAYFADALQSAAANHPQIEMLDIKADKHRQFGKVVFEDEWLQTTYYFSVYTPPLKNSRPGTKSPIRGGNCPSLKTRVLVKPRNLLLAPLAYPHRLDIRFREEAETLFRQLMSDAHVAAGRQARS